MRSRGEMMSAQAASGRSCGEVRIAAATRSAGRPSSVCPLPRWLLGVLADVLANSFLRRNSMNFGPARIEMIIATSAATRTRARRVASLSATTSSPTAREPSTSTTSPGRRSSRSASAASAAVATHRAGSPFGHVSLCERTDGDHLGNARSSAPPRDLALIRRSGRAELRHLAEHRDTPRIPARSARLCERRPHRERVRVVAVVDQQHVVGQRQLLLAAAARTRPGARRPRSRTERVGRRSAPPASFRSW